MDNSPITLSQLGLYNPQRMSDDLMEKLFIARKNIFAFLLQKITQEKANSIPQHHLVIALRGMGKSSLLKRIEVELRKDIYNKKFVPLLYPEEQYNLSNLTEFWLNSLDALADTLETEKHFALVAEIDEKISQFAKTPHSDKLVRDIYQFFKSITEKMNRRPVLLLDNLNILFNRLEKTEQHQLRAWLMENNAPILVGASAVSIDDTHNYGAPFYDAFQMHYLPKLTFQESIDILKELAVLTHSEEVLPAIQQEVGRLETIHHLTGGNPRTSVMLFRLIAKGFSKELKDDLEALLDEITPLYKARFEILSPTQQRIVDAIALNWNPINLGDLRASTRLENNQLSPQLKRLYEVGWIEKLDAYQAKGHAYQISERFFNIWFLMRRSSRRQKRELLCLSKFLESFYGEHLPGIARGRLTQEAASANHVAYNLAMAEVIPDGQLREQLRDKSYEDLKKLAESDPKVLREFDFTELEQERVQRLIKKYYSNLEEEKYTLAEQALLKLIEIINQPAFFNELGNLYKNHLQDFKAAEKAYLNAIELDEKYAYPWNGLGNLYQEHLQDFKAAEKAYLNAIELDKKLAYPWNGLGNLYQYELKNYPEAEKAYLKAIELDEKYAYPWNGLGDLCKNHLKDFKAAEKAYFKAIELDEKDAIPWNGLGNLYKNHLKDFKAAEKAYFKAIELDEKYAYPWNGLGNLYQHHLKDFKAAEKAYLKAIELDEKYAYPWNGLGNLYQHHLKDFKAAEKAYLKAIELDEQDAYPWNGLGNLYQHHLKDFKAAEKAYFKAIELDEKDAYPWNGLGNLYQHHLKDFKAAEKAYFKAIELYEKDAYPWNGLGNLYQYHLKDFKAAEKSYQKAIELDEKIAAAWNGLGNLYQTHLQDFKAAEKAYLKAIELDEQDAYSWNGLGNLYQDNLKKYPESEQCYLKALAIGEDKFVYKINLIFLYRDKLNRREDAWNLFQTIEVTDESINDAYHLHQTLFFLYEKNQGLAVTALEKALQLIGQEIPLFTHDDWNRFAAVIQRLGYTEWFLGVLADNGFDIILAPYYVAVKALNEKDQEGYLNSRAVEVREPAKKIMERIAQYL